MKKIIALLAVTAIIVGNGNFVQSVRGIENISGMIEGFEPGNDFGDYTFFDSDMIYTGPDEAYYPNLTAETKVAENTIELGRLDYENPERPDYIYMKKNSVTDCFINVFLRYVGWEANTEKNYTYYLIEGDFKKDTLGTKDQVFMLRDLSDPSYDNRVDVSPVYFETDGTINLSGTPTDVKITAGEWFNFKLAIDLVQHKAYAYYKNTYLGKIDLKENLTTISMIRYALVTGNGDVYIDNMRVTGLVKPYSNSSDYRTSVFSDEVSERTYLEDKIAVHAYGKQMYVNGEKSAISPEPVYDKAKDELYMSKDSLKKLFSLDGEITVDGETVSYGGNMQELADGIKTVSGEEYIGVKAFGQKIVGKEMYSSRENGLIIFSDTPLRIDDSQWRHITYRDGYSTGGMTLLNGIDHLNWFMTFERPEPGKILADFQSKTKSQHPRVMLSASDFDNLRAQYNLRQDYKAIADGMIYEADKKLTEDVVTYTFDDSFRMLTTAEELLKRFRLWGYAYQMTGDSKYPQRAYKEFEAVAKFPDFNTSHIIDTGQFCTAFAIGYDWMYEAFTEQQHELIEEFVMKKALRPLASGLYGGITSRSAGTRGWSSFKCSTNYNAIINSGIITAATAFMELDPQWCARTISDSLKSSEYAYMLLPPGGGWVEGYPYWNYCMEAMINQMSTCDSAFGSTYGIENAQGIRETLNYAMAVNGSSGINNYHDAGTGVVSNKVYTYGSFTYLAKKFNNVTASVMRRRAIDNNQTSRSILDAMYYDFDISGTEDLSAADTVQKIDGIELFSVRETYDKNEKGLYFSTHFGPTSCYHSQNDTGTFVLDLMGERWADDLGADDYLLQNEQGYKQSELYRYRTEGHNTLTINNGTEHNQTEGLFYDIDKYASNAYSAYMSADLTGLYKDTSAMKMGYYVGDNFTSVTMRTEFTPDKDSEIYWFMHTRADIEIQEEAAYLTKNNKRVKLEFICNGENAEIGEMAAVPLPTSPQAVGQNENSDYKKVYIRFNAKASVPASLTVKISCPELGSTPISDTAISEWSLETPLILSTDYNETDRTMTVNIANPDNILGGGATVIVAGYSNENRFKSTSNEDVKSAGDVTLKDFDVGTGDTVKIFVWRDMVSMSPLVKEYIIDIE